MELTSIERDTEIEFDDSIVDGPEIAALYPDDTELPVKLDENTVTVLSQEVWVKSSNVLAKSLKKKSWNRFDSKHAHRHGAA